jgi:hypothetical protein
VAGPLLKCGSLFSFAVLVWLFARGRAAFGKEARSQQLSASRDYNKAAPAFYKGIPLGLRRRIGRTHCCRIRCHSHSGIGMGTRIGLGPGIVNPPFAQTRTTTRASQIE